MKILIVTHNDTQGGAAKALFRITGHLRQGGHDARMLVAHKNSDAPFVDGPRRDWTQAWTKTRRYLARAVIVAATGSRSADRSLGAFASGLAAEINASDADVVMLGWLGDETLSIAEIGAIRKPLLWRFSDMWALAGTEHYVESAAFSRYTTTGSAFVGRAADLDAWVFRHKRRQWKSAPTVIAPSRWMASCVADSAIGAKWPVEIIPTPVDTDLFRPLDKSVTRAALGLPQDRRLLLFSAFDATGDRIKGWDLLAGALRLLVPARDACVIIGRNPGSPPIECPLPIIDVGRVADDKRMAMLYAAADVAVQPSRLDNLPQSGLEAQACGCPLVAFDTSGLRDLVEDGVTGLLARPFSVEELGAAINAILADPARRAAFSAAARERAMRLWSPEATIPMFVAAFEETRRRHSTVESPQ